MAETKRYSTLDGLRGTAALLVMLFHASSKLPFTAAHGYLAVDLFFALSGFVLALAYEDRFRQGLSVSRFALFRLVRIYPMYAVGTLIGMIFFDGSPLAFLFVPNFQEAGLFPKNVVMWSLLFELFANIAFAAFSIRVGAKILLAILTISGAVTVWGAIVHGSMDLGAVWSTAAFGLARTAFSFTLGVAMFRFRSHFGITSRQSWLGWLLIPALITALAVAPHNTLLYDLVCSFLILPTLLWLGILWEAPKAHILRLLGNLSFPLYCIHAPFVFAFQGSPWGMTVCCCILIMAALCLDRYFDRPVRAALMATIKPRSAIEQAGVRPASA